MMMRADIAGVLSLALVLAYGGTLALAYGDTSGENRGASVSQYCTDLNPQNGLDIEQIMGLWYGNEVITHVGREEGEVVYDSCVVIHLADVTKLVSTSENPMHAIGSNTRNPSYGYDRERSSYDSRTRYNENPSSLYNSQQYGQQSHTRYLRLIWDENGQTTLEYTLRYNQTRPGFWMSAAPQSGSMTAMQYMQFTGTIQVLKAINNQLLLTFCQSLPGGQLFSVVLSRATAGLSPEEVQSIRNLLRRRNLSTTSIRKVCQSDAPRLRTVGALLILTLLAAYLQRETATGLFH